MTSIWNIFIWFLSIIFFNSIFPRVRHIGVYLVFRTSKKRNVNLIESLGCLSVWLSVRLCVRRSNFHFSWADEVIKLKLIPNTSFYKVKITQTFVIFNKQHHRITFKRALGVESTAFDTVFHIVFPQLFLFPSSPSEFITYGNNYKPSFPARPRLISFISVSVLVSRILYEPVAVKLRHENIFSDFFENIVFFFSFF